MIDAIGYVAMAILLISFMMKDIKKLRWVNTLGCAIFIVYGALLGSFPILITNAAIVLVNLYYLFIKKN
ncbi:YgjV family protein [Crocinitomicaceae bacterium]|jgi:hypothetical protein|nr:YgjV family protein [Crocinitomicaceae bacterium]MDG1346479.1 YgjV family protein [Crocinitomicaceae bacterium]MDG2464153.1 YgjV family protein [Crocinitomicaceae bacterium]